ncbi:hypothetical protein CRG98_044633 [Punica granatum]|uniref:Uncharacterized protein n=1 Tax=Punica granatum TaxID=22663 RepID=A0A2I0HUM5_PUNGR|nr:hypothetical protein CRG98_044633 [Punica granatum]
MAELSESEKARAVSYNAAIVAVTQRSQTTAENATDTAEQLLQKEKQRRGNDKGWNCDGVKERESSETSLERERSQMEELVMNPSEQGGEKEGVDEGAHCCSVRQQRTVGKKKNPVGEDGDADGAKMKIRRGARS